MVVLRLQIAFEDGTFRGFARRQSIGMGDGREVDLGCWSGGRRVLIWGCCGGGFLCRYALRVQMLMTCG